METGIGKKDDFVDQAIHDSLLLRKWMVRVKVNVSTGKGRFHV